MAFHVIDAEKGFVGGGGKAFRVGEADKERGSEAGAAGGGKGGDVGKSDAGGFERLGDERRKGKGVVTAGYFWDDATVSAVDVDL